jgi:acetyltransferase-like isoleucine patch superfamily enzyme
MVEMTTDIANDAAGAGAAEVGLEAIPTNTQGAPDDGTVANRPTNPGSREVESAYAETPYLQFTAGRGTRFALALIGILLWPIAIPLASLSRLSDVVFRTCSELLALVPYFPGVFLRYEFYRFALRRCGRNVLIEGGVVFVYRDVQLGDDVLIGRNSIVHHCDIGDGVLIGDRVTLLSGSRQHRFARTDVPIIRQGGEKRRITIEDDCWIGSHAVVMNDVRHGSVVSAGAVVREEVAPLTIVGGVPAKKIGERSGPSRVGDVVP